MTLPMFMYSNDQETYKASYRSVYHERSSVLQPLSSVLLISVALTLLT